jgi:hypothetical protein
MHPSQKFKLPLFWNVYVLFLCSETRVGLHAYIKRAYLSLTTADQA